MHLLARIRQIGSCLNMRFYMKPKQEIKWVFLIQCLDFGVEVFAQIGRSG
jgi:hypothetical protein